MHQCGVAEVKPAIIISLVCEQAFFRFAESDVRVKLSFYDRSIGSLVPASVDQDAVTLGNPLDYNLDAIDGSYAISCCELHAGQWRLAPGIGSHFIDKVELDCNQPIFGGNDVAHAEVWFSAADPFLAGLKFAVRHGAGFRVSLGFSLLWI